MVQQSPHTNSLNRKSHRKSCVVCLSMFRFAPLSVGVGSALSTLSLPSPSGSRRDRVVQLAKEYRHGDRLPFIEHFVRLPA